MERPEPGPRWWGLTPEARRQALLIVLALLALLLFYLWGRFTSDVPVRYHSAVEHFKYGSTGGERSSGIPSALWKVMPKVCADLLPSRTYTPGREYESFGLIYEEGKSLPIGTSQRTYMGVPRVFLNCAVCHVGSVRFDLKDKPQLVPGMPSNTVDLEGFQRFLFDCAADESFDVDQVMAQIPTVERVDFLNRLLLRWVGVPMMRQRLLMLRQRFRYLDWEPPFGPGRVDTFTPAKVLLNFRLLELPQSELAGTADFPSIWLQRKRKGMFLHWDGNNDSVEERNRSAAFGTGAFPPTLDRAHIQRVEDWLLEAEPPAFPPQRIDQALAAQGRPVYEEYCADCHGRNGRDFTGNRVGQVEPLARIATDRRRLDSYSYELSVVQNTLYAGYGGERFSHFRKTYGYSNMPLDGLWLRAPYLHNGSVPTLRDLLEPSANRPTVFYRGFDLYDPVKVGFVSEPEGFDAEGRRLPREAGDARRYFKFAVECAADPGQCDRYAIKCTQELRGPQGRTVRTVPVVCGNGNAGHEGPEYGTDLPEAEKRALLEYLKTF